MKTSELVKEFLQKQGIRYDELPTWDIVFKYEMRTFIYDNNDSLDERFFKIILPRIYEVTPANRNRVLEEVNRVTRLVKVAKTFVIENSVWVTFEILLDSTPNISDLMPRALEILLHSHREFTM